MNLSFVAGISAALIAAATAQGSLIISLDASRTGNEEEEGDDRYLTSASMVDATNILLAAGFTIQTTSLFTTANIAGAQALYTGAVDVAFIAQELTDIKAFVAGGGGLVIQRDWNGYYPAADPLLAAFGVTIDERAQGIGGNGTPVNLSEAHPIWSGPAGSVTTYDQVFSSHITGGANIIGVHGIEGTDALGVLNWGLGRVVILTDMNAWDSLGDPVTPMPGNNNGIVWENIFHVAVPAPGSLALLALAAVGPRRRRRL